jgi:hypothetical protein
MGEVLHFVRDDTLFDLELFASYAAAPKAENR